MNEFQEARKAYEDIPVPEELSRCVQAGIRRGKVNRLRRMWRKRLAAVVACLAVTVGVLNLSPAMASAAADLPVLGGLFQVLTVRSFTDKNDDRTVTVEQPGLTGSDFADEIDRAIQIRVDEKLAEGEKLVADYKNAFLATGGTEEEWAQHDNTVSITYEIKSRTDTTVSFVVSSSVSIANAYQEQFFYNLDLAENQELTLAGLLGEDWVNICNDSIRAQMAASEDPTVFFTEEEGGFTSVDEETGFYISQSGNPVVVFPRYTVAPGFMGAVEFEIGR